MAPIQTPTYRDPGHPKRVRPNLIGGLMQYATTRDKSPLENQVSEALCWLIDRSPVLAKATVELFLTNDEASDVLTRAGSVVGASTRISLRALPGGSAHYYFPDVWIAGAGRSFQLMIEVKVDAELHAMEVDRATLRAAFPDTTLPGGDSPVVSIVQHDAYRLAWSRVDASTDADSRFVGILSLAPTAASAVSDVAGISHARSVTWGDLHGRFTELVDSVDADIRLVLEDFLAAVNVHVLRAGPEVTEAEQARVLEWGRRLLAATRGDPTWVPATKTGFGNIVEKDDYIGFHMFFASEAISKADIHMYITHPAGHLALVEQPESAIYLLSYGNADLEQGGLIAAAWEYGKDRTGYAGYRRVLPLTALGWATDAEPSVDDVLPRFTEWIRESLESCGLD